MAKEEKKESEEKVEGEPAKKSSKKMLIIIVAVVVLLGVGAGAFFAMGGKKAEEGEEGADEAAADEEHAAEGEEGGEIPGAVVPLDVFIVNLGVKGSFLKTAIQLELATPEPGHDFERNIPKMRDAVIRVLSGKVATEILAAEGKDKLREEVKKSINDTLGTEDVVQVFFTEFIVQ